MDNNLQQYLLAISRISAAVLLLNSNGHHHALMLTVNVIYQRVLDIHTGMGSHGVLDKEITGNRCLFLCKSSIVLGHKTSK